MKVLVKAQRPDDKHILFDFKQFARPEILQKIMRQKDTKNLIAEYLLADLEVKEVPFEHKSKAQAEADLVIGESYSSRRLV